MNIWAMFYSNVLASLFALSTLVANGLLADELQEIYRTKILSKVMYTSPEMGGCNKEIVIELTHF